MFSIKTSKIMLLVIALALVIVTMCSFTYGGEWATVPAPLEEDYDEWATVPAPTMPVDIAPVESPVVKPEYNIRYCRAVEGLNIRKEPSLDAEIIGGFNIGDAIYFLQYCEDTAWSQIRYNHNTAYVASRYISMYKPTGVKYTGNFKLSSYTGISKKSSTTGEYLVANYSVSADETFNIGDQIYIKNMGYYRVDDRSNQQGVISIYTGEFYKDYSLFDPQETYIIYYK